jgi:DNA polymerase V
MTGIKPIGRGGPRPHAGRKRGSGSYGEPTDPIRIPVSHVPTVRAWLQTLGQRPEAPSIVFPALGATPLPLPLYACRVAAGFPSPADDHLEATLDLNQYLIKHPAATFFAWADGRSMINIGIHPGDLLVVDRAREPCDGRIVVAVVNGEMTLKKLKIEDGRVWLMPENPDYAPIELREGMDLTIWGVVTHVIHALL